MANSPDATNVTRPALNNLLNTKTIGAAGSNHILTLTNRGKVWSLGVSEQNQLGRRIFD
jgi:alpha-tubulin suppressor-like RCC1 family protein